MFKSREARHAVLIRARMRAGGPAADVCVRNVSSRGMLLQAHEVPAPGSYVEILLPDAVVVGRVMWAAERRFGIRARDRIPVDRLIGGHKRQSADTAANLQSGQPGVTGVQVRRDARFVARSMQFLFVALCGAAAAGLIALAAFRALSSVSDKISQHL
jgi:hypothetical protein